MRDLGLYRKAAFAARPVSQRDMEELAERYLRSMFPDNLLAPVALDVMELLDRLEGPPINVLFRVADLGFGEEGYADPIKRQIVIDTKVYREAERGDGHARMTCCHEVGHIPHISQVREIIRDGLPRLQRSLNIVVPIYQDPEWQAFAVGRALLMPRATVPGVYRRGGIAAMMDEFQVSHSAAEVRVNTLRKIGALPG